MENFFCGSDGGQHYSVPAQQYFQFYLKKAEDLVKWYYKKFKGNY